MVIAWYICAQRVKCFFVGFHNIGSWVRNGFYTTMFITPVYMVIGVWGRGRCLILGLYPPGRAPWISRKYVNKIPPTIPQLPRPPGFFWGCPLNLTQRPCMITPNVLLWLQLLAWQSHFIPRLQSLVDLGFGS